MATSVFYPNPSIAQEKAHQNASFACSNSMLPSELAFSAKTKTRYRNEMVSLLFGDQPILLKSIVRISHVDSQKKNLKG
jgi:hypothetical protein